MRVVVDYTLIYKAQSIVRVLSLMNIVGPPKVAVRRFGRHLSTAIDDIDPDRLEILGRHGTLQDDGSVTWSTPESQTAANKEFLELQKATKVEIECIESSVFETIDGEGVVDLMLGLGELVFDPLDHETKPKRVDSKE